MQPVQAVLAAWTSANVLIMIDLIMAEAILAQAGKAPYSASGTSQPLAALLGVAVDIIVRGADRPPRSQQRLAADQHHHTAVVAPV